MNNNLSPEEQLEIQKQRDKMDTEFDQQASGEGSALLRIRGLRPSRRSANYMPPILLSSNRFPLATHCVARQIVLASGEVCRLVSDAYGKRYQNGPVVVVETNGNQVVVRSSKRKAPLVVSAEHLQRKAA